MRSQLLRKLKLPDIHHVVFPSEGITPAVVLILVSNNGKTHSFGKLKFSACLKSVFTWPILSIAFYLFSRWNIDNGPFHNFKHPENWYDIKVFNTSLLSTGVAYTMHRDFMTECFHDLEIKSSRKIHPSCGSGVLFAEMTGCNEDSLCRLGN
jgi:hypothetical protein